MKIKYILRLVLTCCVICLFSTTGHATEDTDNPDDKNCASGKADEITEQNQSIPPYTQPKPLEG